MHKSATIILFPNAVIEAEKVKPRERKPSTSSSSSGPYDDADNVSDESDYEVAGTSSSKGNKINLDYIQQFIADKFRLHKSDEGASSSQILKTVDSAGIVDHWKEKGFKKIVTMVGAGISTCKFQPGARRCSEHIFNRVSLFSGWHSRF